MLFQLPPTHEKRLLEADSINLRDEGTSEKMQSMMIQMSSVNPSILTLLLVQPYVQVLLKLNVSPTRFSPRAQSLVKHPSCLLHARQR